jgi:hypothetical protein
MGEHRKGQENDHRHRHLTEDASLAHPDEPRFKTADRAARGEQKRRAPERRQPANALALRTSSANKKPNPSMAVIC